jgi:hypothetical protein
MSVTVYRMTVKWPQGAFAAPAKFEKKSELPWRLDEFRPNCVARGNVMGEKATDRWQTVYPPVPRKHAREEPPGESKKSRRRKPGPTSQNDAILNSLKRRGQTFRSVAAFFRRLVARHFAIGKNDGCPFFRQRIRCPKRCSPACRIGQRSRSALSASNLMTSVLALTAKTNFRKPVRRGRDERSLLNGVERCIHTKEPPSRTVCR